MTTDTDTSGTGPTAYDLFLIEDAIERTVDAARDLMHDALTKRPKDSMIDIDGMMRGIEDAMRHELGYIGVPVARFVPIDPLILDLR